jgi:hypothetical protein
VKLVRNRGNVRFRPFQGAQARGFRMRPGRSSGVVSQRQLLFGERLAEDGDRPGTHAVEFEQVDGAVVGEL